MPGRLYHYYFEGSDKPITIQATTNRQARSTLVEVLPYLPQYAIQDLIAETTSSLVTGISTMIKNGKKLIWNGQTWAQAKPEAPKEGPRRFILINGRWKEIK
jgi:hypothetical protein